MTTLVSTAQLRDLTGYQRGADVKRCLLAQGIKCFDGKDGPWTTLDLINAAGGIKPAPGADQPAPYSLDELFGGKAA